MNRLTSLLTVFKDAFAHAMAERLPDAAAAMTYYAILSIFPLLLLTISVGSYFVDSAEIQDEVLEAVAQFIPQESQELIRANIAQVLSDRANVNVFGLLFLLWGAAGVFNTLQVNLSRAWPRDPLRGIWKAQLTAFLMVAAFFILLVLFSLMQAGIIFFTEQLQKIPFISGAITYVSRIALFLFTFLAFAMLYRWVPAADVRWVDAMSGAFFATVLSGAATAGFGAFLSSGLNRYNLVYGSLGALVGFMFWLLIMNMIILAGGYLSSAVARHR